MSKLESPILSIIIPTKDREEIFLGTLKRAVDAISSVNAEIIVVNDSINKLGSEFNFSDKVSIFSNNNKGVATARNLGASMAKSDLYLFLDSDMWLKKENIDTYLRLYNKLGDVVINLNWEYPIELKVKLKETAIGRYLELKNVTSMKGWNKGNNWNDQELFESTGIAGANLLISKKNFNLLNGYNESFAGIGMEDYDLSERIKASGIKTYIYPKSMMYHNEANKLELKGWLKRNYESHLNVKQAVNIGYKKLEIKHAIIKRVIYFCAIPFSGLLINLAQLFSHNAYFDFLYQRLVDGLTGLYIYKGYNGYSL